MMKRFDKSFTQQEPISEAAIARAAEILGTARVGIVQTRVVDAMNIGDRFHSQDASQRLGYL